MAKSWRENLGVYLLGLALCSYLFYESAVLASGYGAAVAVPRMFLEEFNAYPLMNRQRNRGSRT